MKKQTHLNLAKEIMADLINIVDNTSNVTPDMVKLYFIQTSTSNGEYKMGNFCLHLNQIQQFAKEQNITLTYPPIKNKKG